MIRRRDDWLSTVPQDRQRELLAKHTAFWRREPGGEALIGFVPVSQKFPLRNLNIGWEGPFTAADVTPAVIQADTRYRPPILPEDDLFPAKIPLESLPWAEGYSGARVLVSAEAGAAWTEPGERIPQSLEQLRALCQPAWMDKLVQATEMNVSAAGDDLLISEALLRGPADCLESVIGSENLCLWCHDRPELLAAMTDLLADSLIELGKAQLQALPRFHDGTINRYRLWAPGENVITAADVALLVSPEHFGDIFVPAYRKLARSFDTLSVHFHSSAWRHAEALLDIAELAAIEWGLDPTGPDLEELVPTFARVLEAKPLIIKNIKTDAQIDMLLDRLPHEGLCIIVRKDY